MLRIQEFQAAPLLHGILDILVRIFLEKVPIMATLLPGAEGDLPIDHLSTLAVRENRN